MSDKSFDYDIVLSFASEDRDYVEEVAEHLTRKGVSVFYDKYETAKLWGRDLYTHLDEVYRKRARYCVMFISEHYRTKLWTNHERESAQARAFEENEEYILPVKFDDTEIPGVRPTTFYVDARKLGPDQLSDLIVEKLSMSRESSSELQSDGFRLPRLPRVDFDVKTACLELIRDVKSSIDARVSALKAAGVEVQKTVSKGQVVKYRFRHFQKLVYFLDFWLGKERGTPLVGFLDGWHEPKDSEGKSYTLWST